MRAPDTGLCRGGLTRYQHGLRTMASDPHLTPKINTAMRSGAASPQHQLWELAPRTVHSLLVHCLPGGAASTCCSQADRR